MCVGGGALRRPTLPSGVFVVFYEPGQAKVSDFAHQAVSHQDVGGAQVSVDVVHPLDVGHACCHLEHSTLRAAASALCTLLHCSSCCTHYYAAHNLVFLIEIPIFIYLFGCKRVKATVKKKKNEFKELWSEF